MSERLGPERFLAVRRVASLMAVAAWGLVAVFYGITVVHGGSMEPTIAPGDVVVYRRSAATVSQGDIVYFSHSEWPQGVVHRVAGVLPDGSVRTQGDANRVADRDPVPRQRIRGVATVVIPCGRAVAAVADLLR